MQSVCVYLLMDEINTDDVYVCVHMSFQNVNNAHEQKGVLPINVTL